MKTAFNWMAVMVLVAGVSSASAAVVTVDDFSGASVNTSLWTVGGGVSQSGGELDIPGGGSVEQASNLIPLPTQNGEVLTIEYALRSSDADLADTISVILRGMDSSGNYASKWLGGVQIRSDLPGKYYARNPTGNVPTTVDDFGTSYDIHQSIFSIDGSGTKKFSAQVLKAGETTWTPLVGEYNVDWNAGGVTQTQFYALLTGSGSETFVDYLQYDLVPEPATLGLLGFGGLALLRRRRR